jgi:hypothetical protein
MSSIFKNQVLIPYKGAYELSIDTFKLVGVAPHVWGIVTPWLVIFLVLVVSPFNLFESPHLKVATKITDNVKINLNGVSTFKIDQKRNL